MIGVRLLSRCVFVLVALTLSAGACAPGVCAYDDGPSQGRVVARVICESDGLQGTTWFDVVALGTGDGARRLCDANLRSLTCSPGHRRATRPCAEEALGPSPEVSANTTILRHTMPASILGVLLDAVEQGRPPDETSGHVLEHLVFANRDACVAVGEAMAQRARESEQSDARVWTEGQLEHFERQQREAREELAALERRTGGPVAARMAKLQALLARERRPAERKRIKHDIFETSLAELEDERLRRSMAQSQQIIEGLRSPPPSTPTETFTCFPPRGRQPALDTAQ